MSGGITTDPATLFRLDGKSALIVGGYGGIGKVTSQIFVQQGAAVAIAGRSGVKATNMARELCTSGARAIGVHVDAAQRRPSVHMV